PYIVGKRAAVAREAILARSLKSNESCATNMSPTWLMHELLKNCIEVVTRAHFDPHRLDLQVCSGCRHARPVDRSRLIEVIHQTSNFGGARDHFQCQRKLFSRQGVRRYKNPGHLAARASFARSQTEADRIDHRGGDDWD